MYPLLAGQKKAAKLDNIFVSFRFYLGQKVFLFFLVHLVSTSSILISLPPTGREVR